VPLPLKGVVVLDLTRLLPGPFATQLLADLGADVIKVEEPTVGDYMRLVPPAIGDTSYPFLMVNRGKRSAVIDLKREEGRRVLYRLARKADVFVEQFRARSVKRLGIDYPRIRRANPRIVYCSFGGYGRTGPYADRPGHDLNFEAMAGILGVTASREGRPVIPGVPVSDLASAYLAAFSIVASLHRRKRFGGGEFLDVSIYDASVSLMVLNLARYLETREVPMPGETIVTGLLPCYNLYETGDGRWLAIACVEPQFWRRLCEVLGLPGRVDDGLVGGERGKEAIADLTAAFRTRTLAEWLAALGPDDMPITPVLRVDEVVADPHLAARGLLPEVAFRGGRRRVLAHPARRGASRPRPPAKAPAKGEHTAAVLRWAGYTAKEVRALAADGVIGLTRP